MEITVTKKYVFYLIIIFLIIGLITLVLLNRNVKKVEKVEKFIDSCLGARDGVSGCRDCCRKFGNFYGKCVYKCMNF